MNSITQQPRFGQVFSTAMHRCTGHWVFWLWWAILGIQGAVCWPKHLGTGLYGLWIINSFFGGLLVPMLLAEYFTTYRWRLMPHYRRDYLAAAGLLAAGFFVLMAAWSNLCAEQALWPGIGLALLAFALGVWASGRRGYAAIGALLIPVFTLGRLAWPHVAQSAIDNWPLNVGSGAAGGLLLAWYGVWLANLTEDHPTHAGLGLAVAGLNTWRLPRLGQYGAKAAHKLPTSATGPAAMLLVRLQERLLERALRLGPGGVGWKVRRWGLATLPRPLFFVMSALALLQTFVACCDVRLASSVYLPQVILLSMTVAQVLVFNRASRSAMFGLESLRPVTREELMRQRGAGLLCHLAIWLILFAAVWSVLCLASPARNPLAAMVGWGCIQIAVLFALSALIAWQRTVGSTSLEAIVGLGGMLAVGAGFLLMATQRDLPWAGYPSVLLLAAFVIAAAGAAFFWAAYRRWLVIDLG